MDHVIDDVAQEAPGKHSARHRLGQEEPQDYVEEGNAQRSRHGGEDQAGFIEGCLWMERLTCQKTARPTCL